jgi:excisionase family DNA binding protein
MSEKLLTASEVATRWGVHKATVLRLFHTGVLPGVAIARGRTRTVVRFRSEAIGAWEKMREKTTTVPPPRFGRTRKEGDRPATTLRVK